MKTLNNEITDLILSYNNISHYYKYKNVIKYYERYCLETHNNNSKYIIVIENILEFINNYINILIKYNKVKINNILKDSHKDDNDIDINKLYEVFISSRYLFDIMNKKYLLYKLKSKTYNNSNYRILSFEINYFDNDFYKILLTTDKISNCQKRFIINDLFVYNIKTIYNDVFLLAILFYNNKLSMEEFIEKHNYIKTNYKLIISIINYLNDSLGFYNNHNYYVKYNEDHYFEAYLIIFCYELVKYFGYENLLYKYTNIPFDRIYNKHNVYSAEFVLNDITHYNKFIINNKYIYNNIKLLFPNSDYILLFDDFVKKYTRKTNYNINSNDVYINYVYKRSKEYNKEYIFNNDYEKMLNYYNNSKCDFLPYSECLFYMGMFKSFIKEKLTRCNELNAYILRNLIFQSIIDNKDLYKFIIDIINCLNDKIKNTFYEYVITKEELIIINKLFNINIEI